MILATIKITRKQTVELSTMTQTREEAMKWITTMTDKAIRNKCCVTGTKISSVITDEEQFGFLQGNEECAAEWQTHS